MISKMQFTIKNIFKVLFFVGCGLAFLGIFLDFYSFQGIHSIDGNVVAWNYNLFTGWTSPISESNPYNTEFQPPNFNISIILQITLMVTVILSLFCMILKGLNYTTNLSKLMFYAYIHFFLLLLISFYVFIFPLFVLVPSGLHFPFILIMDNDILISFRYSIGIGYILELLAFICVFSYVLFYIQTIRNYEIEKTDQSDKILQEMVEESQKAIDIEQAIAQERISLELEPIHSRN